MLAALPFTFPYPDHLPGPLLCLSSGGLGFSSSPPLPAGATLGFIDRRPPVIREPKEVICSKFAKKLHFVGSLGYHTLDWTIRLKKRNSLGIEPRLQGSKTLFQPQWQGLPPELGYPPKWATAKRARYGRQIFSKTQTISQTSRILASVCQHDRDCLARAPEPGAGGLRAKGTSASASPEKIDRGDQRSPSFFHER